MFSYTAFACMLRAHSTRLVLTSTYKGCGVFRVSLCENFSLSAPCQHYVAADDKRIPGVNDCPKDCLCSRNIEADYKNVRLLSQFVSHQTGMILPRTITRVCLSKQREIAKEIKKAIQMGFMPATHKLRAYLNDPRLF